MLTDEGYEDADMLFPVSLIGQIDVSPLIRLAWRATSPERSA